MHRALASVAGPFDSSNPQKRVVSILTMFFSCVALVCSILTLSLIKRLKIWNPQTSLIWWMSVFQCLYDFSFFIYLSQTDKTSWDYYLSAFSQLFSGVAVTLFTNVITAVLLYVIWTRKNLDLFRYYHWVLLVTLGPAFAIGIAYLVNRADYEYLDSTLSPAYYWVRLGSILINAVVYFVTQSTVNKITGRVSHSTLKKSSAAEVAIVTLTRRSKYYWIVQAISRSGAAIYEFVYGYHGFKGGNAPDKQYIGAIFFAILTPSAAIGYLAIFLLMQPRAYDSLVELLWIDIPNMFGCTKNAGQDEQPSKGSNKAIKAFAQSGYSVSDSHSIVSGAGMSGHLDEQLLNNQSAASSPGSSTHGPATATATLHEAGYSKGTERFQPSGVPSTVVEANSIADSCEMGRGMSALSPPAVGTISGTLAGGGGVSRCSADPGSPSGPGAERISRSVSEASSHTAHSPPPNAQAVQTSNWNVFINHLGSDLVANMVGPGDKAVGLQRNSGGLGSSKAAISVGTLSQSSMRRNFGNNSLQDLNQLEDDELIDILGKESLYSDADDAGVAQLTEFNIHAHATGGKSGEAIGNPVLGISTFSRHRSGTPIDADDDAPPSI
jgi:hypothetical protein